jgi:hypothetical protein
MCCVNPLVNSVVYSSVILRMVNAMYIYSTQTERSYNTSDIIQGFLLDDMHYSLSNAPEQIPNVYWSWVGFYLWSYQEGQDQEGPDGEIREGNKYARLAHNIMFMMFKKLSYAIGYRVTRLSVDESSEMSDYCYCSDGELDTLAIRSSVPSGTPGEIQYCVTKKCVGILLGVALIR